MEEISFKEVLLSVGVAFLVLAVAIFINPFIKDGFMDDIRTYQRALQIDNDPSQFEYAYRTSVGNVFAYGRMKANSPVTAPELLGQYAIIQRVTERYTQHSRQVCNGYDDDGDCTGYRTEYYYTWDTHRRETLSSDSFDFLSVSFPQNHLNLSTQGVVALNQDTVESGVLNRARGIYLYERDTWWDSEGDLRFYYNVLPTEFNASVFANFSVDSLQLKVYYEKTRVEIVAEKERGIKIFDFFYYFFWLVTVGGGYYYWAHSYGEIE